jgi:hypothetical protein
MSERLYTLLEVSQEVLKSLKDAHATIERLTTENLYLEREIGKARLLADMRLQKFADDLPALLRRQAE